MTIFDMLDALEAGIFALRGKNGISPSHLRDLVTSHDLYGTSAASIRPETVREQLEQMGLSMTEFSAIFGIGLNSMQDWLTGQHPIPSWVPVSIIILGQLQPSLRRNLLRPGPRAGTGPVKPHPFSRIDEL